MSAPPPRRFPVSTDAGRRERCLSVSIGCTLWPCAALRAGWGKMMQSRRICFLVAALGAAYVAAGAVSNLIPAESRALVSLCLITMLSMIASAFCQDAAAQDDYGNGCGNGAGNVRDLLLAPAVRSDGSSRAGPPISGTACVSRTRCHKHRGGRHCRFGFFSGKPGVSISVDCVWCDGNGVVRLLRAGRPAGREANSRQALLRRVVMLEQSSDRNRLGASARN